MSKTKNPLANINFQPLFNYMDEKFVTKEEFKLELSHLPTKDEFYTKMDEVMGELKTIREEQTLISHKVANHDDQLEKINRHLGFSAN